MASHHASARGCPLRARLTVGALIQKILRPGQGPSVSVFFVVVGRFPLVFGLVSYPPGPILESVFLWRVSVDRNLPVPAIIPSLFFPLDQEMATK